MPIADRIAMRKRRTKLRSSALVVVRREFRVAFAWTPTPPMSDESCFDSLCLQNIDTGAGAPAGILLEMVIFAYCFIGLAIVCDKYLVVSLETLCVRWGIREDVAGASFMAFGSAAPEIIINAIGAFQGQSNLGVGAIIGSGMIAFAIIPGLCALSATHDLVLKRRPLARDSATYVVALILLVIFMSDAVIEWWESMILFMVYVGYIALVFLSPRIRAFLRKRKRSREYQRRLREAMATGATREQLEELRVTYERVEEKKSFVVLQQEAAAARNQAHVRGVGDRSLGSSLLNDGDRDASESPRDVGLSGINSSEPAAATNGNVKYIEEEEDDDDADVEARPVPVAEDEEDEAPDNSTFGKVRRGITKPLHFAFDWTCKPCEHDGPTAHWYPLTFAVAFVWVSLFSFIISAIAGRWNDLTGLPLALFGIVLVAVGAEIPDTISSLAVARRGYGSMAISNSCGSQITNILFGLGLPWTLSNIASSVEEGTAVCIDEHNELTIAAGFQFFNLASFISVVLLTALATQADKALLTKMKGYILISVYVVAAGGFCLTSFLVKPETDPRCEVE